MEPGDPPGRSPCAWCSVSPAWQPRRRSRASSVAGAQAARRGAATTVPRTSLNRPDSISFIPTAPVRTNTSSKRWAPGASSSTTTTTAGWMSSWWTADRSPTQMVARRARHRLYRNRRDGTFEDVTSASRIVHQGFGMGACAGDHDNDGWIDLYVTSDGANMLYRNAGRGTFSDVTQSAGVGSARMSTSCAFADIDRDGDLDLFVAHYVDLGAGEMILRRQPGARLLPPRRLPRTPERPLPEQRETGPLPM